MIASTQTEVRTICSIEGVTLPEAVTSAIELAEKIREVQVPPHDVGRAFVDAVAAGRDPYSDKTVTVAILRRETIDYHGGAVDLGWADAIAVIAEHADEIVESWRVPFNRAAADLAAAVPSIGHWSHNSTQALDILNRGGDGAAMWVQVKNALKVIDQIVMAWQALARIARRYNGSDTATLIVADLSYEQYQKLQQEARKANRKKIDAWDVARAGHRVHLANFSDMAARGQHRQPTETDTEYTRPRAQTALHTAVLAGIRPEARDLALEGRRRAGKN